MLEFHDGNSVTENAGGERSTFAFDYAFGGDATQQEVYDGLGRPILDYAFEGYNGTILAYGQTGSGKSHSVMGSADDLGIIPRLSVELFERIEQAPPGVSFVVSATYLELYNEVICDLLNPGSQGLKIRQHIASGIYVEGLTEVQVSSFYELQRLITEGNRARDGGDADERAIEPLARRLHRAPPPAAHRRRGHRRALRQGEHRRSGGQRTRRQGDDRRLCRRARAGGRGDQQVVVRAGHGDQCPLAAGDAGARRRRPRQPAARRRRHVVSSSCSVPRAVPLVEADAAARGVLGRADGDGDAGDAPLRARECA